MIGGRATFARYIEASGRDSGYPAWCAALIAPTATAVQVEQHLGPPDLRTGSSLAYRLDGRLGYVYVFDFDAGHRALVRSGFDRVPAVSLPAGTPPPVGATRTEVTAAMGEPASVFGWWPNETWEYDSGLTLTFRHGVLEAPSSGNPSGRGRA